MHTEFKRAVLPGELRALMAFDRKVFPPADRFPASYWKVLDCFWLLIQGVKVGCCAFEADTAFDDSMPGSLYIATTGILPRFQRKGFGLLIKSWEIAYARQHGFSRIVTNTRKKNRAMIALNRRVGFETIRTVPRYYSDPVDATVVMELLLKPVRAGSRPSRSSHRNTP